MALTVILSATLPTEVSIPPGVVTPLKTIVSALIIGTSLALSVTPAKPQTITVTQPSEISSVPGAVVSGRAIIIASIPSETEVVPGALSHAKAVGLGVPSEVDSPIGLPKTLTLSLVSEVSSVPGMAVDRTMSIPLVSDTESVPGAAFPIRSVGLSIVSETDVPIGLPKRANGSVILKFSLAATGHVNKYHANGSVTLASLVTAASTFVPSWAGTPVLPALNALGTLCIGASYAGATTLPVLVGDGSANSGAALTLPMFTTSATMAAGKALNGVFDIPMLAVTGTLSVPAVANATIALPIIQVGGEMLTGAVMDGAAALQLLSVTGTISILRVFNAALVLPAVTAAGAMIVGAQASADVTLPAVTATGDMSNAVATTAQGFVLNTKLLLHTKYSSFPFTAFGQLGTDIYGGDANGLYRLDGADDAGTSIAAMFLSGADDYDSAKLKAQNVVYLGYETDGTVEILIGTDGSTTFDNAYPVNRDMSPNNLRPARVEIGRGLRSRYWRTGVRNVAGSFFKVYELSHGVSKLKRKS